MPNGWLSVAHCKQEPYSCLVACVRMVLTYYGRDLTEGAVRQLLGTQPSGTHARVT
jgi:ABC-type bacteriocin/lantibiotic exporter with double-glycine peptidase domain